VATGVNRHIADRATREHGVEQVELRGPALGQERAGDAAAILSTLRLGVIGVALGLGRCVGRRRFEAEQVGERIVGQRQEVGARDGLPVEAGYLVAAGVLQFTTEVQPREPAGVAWGDMQDEPRRGVLALEHAGLELDQDLVGFQGPVRGVIAPAGEEEAQGQEDERAVQDLDRPGPASRSFGRRCGRLAGGVARRCIGPVRFTTGRQGVEALGELRLVARDEAVEVGTRHARGQRVPPCGHELLEQCAPGAVVSEGIRHGRFQCAR
jgi:hypothetical protein